MADNTIKWKVGDSIFTGQAAGHASMIGVVVGVVNNAHGTQEITIKVPCQCADPDARGMHTYNSNCPGLSRVHSRWHNIQLDT